MSLNVTFESLALIILRVFLSPSEEILDL